ncbi:MAG: type IIL restriction-modification enzyme MmeI [Pirellulaceae bacterium]
MPMVWMRTVCGRMKSDYSYSNTIVYNNFPWPQDVTDKQREKVEAAAQHVLDVRAEFPESTLADLYDPLTMPPKLAKAHAALDRAVDQCYRSKPFDNERQRVEFLFDLYQKITQPLIQEPKKSRKKREDRQWPTKHDGF